MPRIQGRLIVGFASARGRAVTGKWVAGELRAVPDAVPSALWGCLKNRCPGSGKTDWIRRAMTSLRVFLELYEHEMLSLSRTNK